MSKKINLIIVDDHQIVIDGIAALLNNHPIIQIVFANTSPNEILKYLKNNQNVDILLTDILMPEMSGIELSKKIRTNYPLIKILALSMSGQGSTVDSLIEACDISGYILKNTGKTELIAAIEKIAKGGMYFSQEVLQELLSFKKVKKQAEEIKLTSRELEIIKLIEQELSNIQIAEKLFISERTVETHRKNIFRKTKTNNALGLIKFAYQHKLI